MMSTVVPDTFQNKIMSSQTRHVVNCVKSSRFEVVNCVNYCLSYDCNTLCVSTLVLAS